MSGTRLGGKKAAQTNIRRYGSGWYKQIGHRGGTAPHRTRPFKADRKLAKRAGSIGGKAKARKR